MASTTFSIRVDNGVRKRLEKLSESTGRSRSFLAAEALTAYLDTNEWQVVGIRKAIASLDRGAGIAHDDVKKWVSSWGRARERATPRRAK